MTERQAIHFIRTLLDRETTTILATSDEQGRPHATPLFFWADEYLNLYWYSSRRSAHSRNIRAHPECSAAVYAPTRNWEKIRGVQMTGEASPYTDSGLIYEYTHKFKLPRRMWPKIERSTSYVFRPRWVRYMDNSFGFGYQKEVGMWRGATRW